MNRLQKDHAQQRQLKLLSVCALIIAVLAVTVALNQLKTVLVPLTIALLLHTMLQPLSDFFSEKGKLPRRLAAAVSLCLGVGFMVLFGAALYYSVNNFSGSFSLYKDRFNRLLEAVGAERAVEGFLRRFELTEVLDIAQAVSKEAVSLSGTLSLVLVFLLFLMAGSYRPRPKNDFYTEIKANISKYIWIKFSVSLTTALLAGIYFHAIRLELALTFSLLVFLLNFIPNLGSIIATFLPLPIAFLQFGFGADFLLVVLIPGIIQFVIGNIVEPKFMGDSFGIHPIAVLSFLIFWGIVWGTIGMFLAVPIMAVVKIVSSHFEELKFVARFLEGDLAELLSPSSENTKPSVRPLPRSG